MQIQEGPAEAGPSRCSGRRGYPPPMLRHVSLLRFTDDSELGSADAVADAVAEALGALRGKIPALRAYRIERDLGLAADNAHLAVVAEFDDAAGHAEYRDHPAHVEVLEQLIRPALATRSAIQFEV